MALSVPTLDTLDLAGKRVLVRVDFNVPQDESGAITDDTRIRSALPTIRAVLEQGGKPVLLTHLGRPKDGPEDRFRVTPVGVRLQELLGTPVVTLPDSVGDTVVEAVAGAPEGTTVLLENVRFNAGETKGDMELAAEYAKLGDVFVQDAFGSCHRDHASVTGLARLLPSAAGLLLVAELAAFDKVLREPERPFVAILGGAKIGDKLPVLEHLIDVVDHLLVGGGMAYTLIAAKGLEIGSSLVEPKHLQMCARLLEHSEDGGGAKIHLPVDHLAAEKFDRSAPIKLFDRQLERGWYGLDIGPRTRRLYETLIGDARTVVWNGPMGVFEWPAFSHGTEAVAKAVAKCPGFTVVGGGDSVAAIEKFDLAAQIDHVSTGGGASLRLLEGKDLPGLLALRSH